MRNIFLSCFVCLAFNSMAQSVGVRLYQNSDFFEVKKEYYPTDKITRSSQVNFNRFSLSIILKTKKVTHELELFIPEITKPTNKAQFPKNYQHKTGGPFSSEFTSYSFRYEIKKHLAGKSDLHFNAGIAVNPYYLLIERNPEFPGYFYNYERYSGASFNIIPEIQYNFTNRFSLVLNTPINVFDFHHKIWHVKNPSIPVRQQKIEDTNEHSFF